MVMGMRIANQAARQVWHGRLTEGFLARTASLRSHILRQPAFDHPASRATPLSFRRHASQLLPNDADSVSLAEDLTQGTSRFQVGFNANGLRFVRRNALSNLLTSTARLSGIWLRDNCRCAQCVNQDTMQRNFRVFDALSVKPIDVKVETGGVRVTWDHEQHESFYEWAFLLRYIRPNRVAGRPTPDLSKRRLWGSEIAQNPPTVGYEEVMDSTSDSGMAKMTDHIMQHGLVFVDNTPFDDPVHTKRLLERIGPIRETHYGGFYDFVPDMAKADTAYTNIALPAHTDTTYFTDPAGLQAFHMLSHTNPPGAPEGAQPTGGESLLVDGFRAAAILMKEDRFSYKILCKYRVPWHASGNQGVTITSDKLFPVIKLMDKDKPNEILRIRWNNDDRGVVPIPQRPGKVLDWYTAAAKWDEILRRSSSEFWFQLKPGRTLIFDNYRVLHGRSAFTGLRRICGAYVNRDDFVSRWRNANLSREKVLAQVIG